MYPSPLFVWFLNALSIALYTFQFFGVILLVQMKHRNCISFYVPLPPSVYNKIVLNISSTYIQNHIRQYYKCLLQSSIQKSQEEENYYVILLTVLFVFSVFQDFFYCFLSAQVFSFSHSFRVLLQVSNSVSLSPENVFISPPTRELTNYKGKNSNFTVEKPVRHYLTKRSKLTPPILRYTAHHLCGILAQSACPHFSLETMSGKPKLKDVLQNN